MSADRRVLSTNEVSWRALALRTERRDFERIQSFLLVYHDGLGRRFVAEPLSTLVELSDRHLAEPTLTLCTEQAQALFDAMYEQGYRPTRRERDIGALPATEHHLEDMRRIAFGFLNAPPPEKDQKLNVDSTRR